MNMRKVAIVTLYDSNIGNRLQNYALQQILKAHGFEAYTLYYSLEKTGFKKIKKNVKILLGWLYFKKYRVYFLEWKRKKIFEHFTDEHIKKGEKINFYKKVKFNANYDYYVTGSDQVWHNWHRSKNELEYFYLMFVPENRRISFSPSIGLDIFPNEDLDVHANGLNGMKALSCREKSGCELIQNLIGKQAELLLDPTFLVGVKVWKKIEKKPKYKTANKYVFLYFLGETDDSVKDFIKKYAIDNKCEIINIFDYSYESQYFTAPDEFIYLIRHAYFIFTDSFHACAFSIMFAKDFLVFRRKELSYEKMGSRLDNLFEVFHMEDRWYTPNKKIEHCKYKDITLILQKEKEKADLYIDRYME